MYYAYILRSENFPNQTYVGSTGDLRRRLAEHNAGKSTHTNKFKPWECIERCSAAPFGLAILSRLKGAILTRSNSGSRVYPGVTAHSDHRESRGEFSTLLILRYSHALAIFQSRTTVRRSTDSNSAISCCFSPPKNCNSMTLAARAFTAASS